MAHRSSFSSVVCLIALGGVVHGASPPNPALGAKIARRSLPERCALTRLLARSYMNMFDWLPHEREDAAHALAFAVILDERGLPGSGLLLRHGERCEAPKVRGAFGFHPYLLTLATNDPPPGDYHWVKVVSGDANHLRFERPLEQASNGVTRSKIFRRQRREQRSARPDAVEATLD